MDKISIYCIQCGKQFDEYWSSLNYGEYGTCSKECKKKIDNRKRKVWEAESKILNAKKENKE